MCVCVCAFVDTLFHNREKKSSRGPSVTPFSPFGVGVLKELSVVFLLFCSLAFSFVVVLLCLVPS